MVISIIAAMAENRVIGRENEMPLGLPSELRRFKEITMGHPVIMGRKTFESIGHPLPGRKNIVITTQQGFAPEGCTVVNDLQGSDHGLCGNADEVFICGGEAVLREALPLADNTLRSSMRNLTATHFSQIPDDFVEVERRKFEDILPYSMVRYERRTG